MLVILFFSFNTKQPKLNQFILVTAQNIYLLTFSYFMNINHPSTLFLQFYKSNYKHPWYNLEIKEVHLGYTTVSSIDFNPKIQPIYHGFCAKRLFAQPLLLLRH